MKYDGELQFYADIPLILGKDNTFIFGKYHSYLFSKKVNENCPYPSCHGTPMGEFVKKENIQNIISEVDAVLLSTRGGKRGAYVSSIAREKGVPIAMFDYLDHEDNYGAEEIEKDLCYQYEYGKDYNLYFKKDLPLGYKTDNILPVAPNAVRPESYEFINMSKEFDVFYSGRARQDRCQKDREESVDLIKKHIINSLIIDHDDRKTFMTTREYWDNISKSRMCLSPSGRVWDSFRHTETGLAQETLLIAPKPYVETTGPKMVDGVNSLLYETELKDGRYSIKDTNLLIEKINYYLERPKLIKKISKRWTSDVLSGHTISARSEYIIRSMEKSFS